MCLDVILACVFFLPSSIFVALDWSDFYCAFHEQKKIKSQMGQFLQNGEKVQIMKLLCHQTVFKISQLFWRAFVLYHLKILSFWS